MIVQELNNLSNYMIKSEVDPHVNRMITAYKDLLNDYNQELQQEISYDVKSLLFNTHREYNIPPSTVIFCSTSNKIEINTDYIITTENGQIFKSMTNIEINNIDYKIFMKNNTLIFDITKYENINTISFFTNLENMDAIFGDKLLISAQIYRFESYYENIILEGNNDFTLLEYLHNNNIGHIFKINVSNIYERNFQIHIQPRKPIYIDYFYVNCIPIQNKFQVNIISDNIITTDHKILSIDKVEQSGKILPSFTESFNGYFCSIQNNKYILRSNNKEKKNITLTCCSSDLIFSELYFKDFVPCTINKKQKIVNMFTFDKNRITTILLQCIHSQTLEEYFKYACNLCNIFCSFNVYNINITIEVIPKIIDQYLISTRVYIIKANYSNNNFIIMRKIEELLQQKFDCKLERQYV